MKLLFALILLLSVAQSGSTNEPNALHKAPTKEQIQQTGKIEESAVTSLIEEFGKRLQRVSLLAPEDIVSKSMQENYGDFVSPGLLAQWQSDPQNAPGRLVSSPWPDRIDVQSVEKLSEKDTYQVKGEIIEVSSTEQANGGVAAKRSVIFEVKRFENHWLIHSAKLGAYDEAGSVVYENTQYGFRFLLPKSWEGYTIVTDKWEGIALGDGNSQSEKVAETGPFISIRHPKWTAENPRQDIPLLTFTLAQWNSLQQDKFHIGAAPIGPRELGRNSGYVFALPARYNFAFSTGYEEVETIINSNPLQPIESSK